MDVKEAKKALNLRCEGSISFMPETLKCAEDAGKQGCQSVNGPQEAPQKKGQRNTEWKIQASGFLDHICRQSMWINAKEQVVGRYSAGPILCLSLLMFDRRSSWRGWPSVPSKQEAEKHSFTCKEEDSNRNIKILTETYTGEATAFCVGGWRSEPNQ